MTQLTRLAAAAAAAAAVATLGACATSRPPPQALVDASAAVQRAQVNPAVLTHAPLELKKATDSLSRADRLQAKGEPQADVVSAAYVAERQAQAAMAIAQAKTNEDSIRTAEADRERARADAREREAERARNVARSAEQRANVAQGQASAAMADAAEAQQRAVQAQARAAEVQQQAAMLQRQLEEMNAKKTDRGMLVTLGDVLFEFNRSEVKPASMGALRKLADFLKAHPDRFVLIEGYTDNVGSASYNEDLSRRRAESVANTLASLGVPPAKIRSAGYGKSYPIADNATDANRALNRRVEVYISEDGQPVRSRGG